MGHYPTPDDYDFFFYNFQSTLTEVEFIKVTGFLGICFFKRILFKICLYRFLCKKIDLPLRPYPIAKIMIWTNLNLYYMRMLPHKLRLFWPICFWKEFLFCFYVNICHPIAIVAPLYTLWLWCKQTWTIFSASTQISAWRSSSEKMYQNVSSPWKKVWPFILTCLNFFCKIIVCARFCWNLV